MRIRNYPYRSHSYIFNRYLLSVKLLPVCYNILATVSRWGYCVVLTMENTIHIRGARQHNLKNVNLDIPKNKLVVFTGVSGSGKSSMAFDTIFAEGQRRYVESLSTYARQFLGVMEKPDVDVIEGLSPSISIDQKTSSRNPRSTVGTVTEIYDYLRLLFARIGHPHCPVCGREIANQSLDEIVSSILALINKTVKDNNKIRFLILSPLVVDRKGEFSSLFTNLKAQGFRYVRVDRVIMDLSNDFVLIKTNKHSIDVVIDRISLSNKDLKSEGYVKNLESRISQSVEQALKLSQGLVIVAEVKDKSLEMPEFPVDLVDHLFSEKFSCPVDNIQLPEIEPRTFSFNSPQGACDNCHGIGKVLKIDPNLVLSSDISITEGGILPFANIFEHDTWYARLILQVCSENGINPRVPIKNLTKQQIDLLMSGSDEREYKVEGTNRFGRTTYIYESFQGVLKELEKRHSETESDWVRAEIEKYMIETICSMCDGKRLKKEALNITINNLSIADVVEKTTIEAQEWIKNISNAANILTDKEKNIGNLIIKEIQARINFLTSVGLEYLTLNRSAGSLAGGEAQRIRLASQIGSGLTGVLYVLDEPTIGLHPRDNQRLIDTLQKLKELGNTVVVVEHDEETIRQADHIVDFGPGAGKDGGYLVAQGSLRDIEDNPTSITGRFLSGKRKIDVSQIQGQLDLPEKKLTIFGCNMFNLKNIDVSYPLSKLVVITGVSGSGKSTLLVETTYQALNSKLNKAYISQNAGYRKIEGVENIDRVILIDQSPIGRTPRSNPATYTKVFDVIRDVFAATREARASGFKKGYFSFNVKGGRCEACEGQGQIKIEMQFMSDLWITCEVCHGKRYNSQILDIHFKGKNISQILSLSVKEAIEFFHSNPHILSKLTTLDEVGLGYIELGQPATTLSGGEAQRVKLASELTKKATGKTVYILDEPTTGLHFADVEQLLKVLKILVSRGNSVFIIEHNLDVIKNADWIIDLGPEGGGNGGYIVAEGNPREVSKSKKSYTGMYLAR